MIDVRWGISRKVSLGLFGIAFVTMLVSGASLHYINRFSSDFQTLSKKMIPASMGGSELMKLTQRLSANAPNIYLAENQLMRKALMNQINDDIGRKDELLQVLLDSGVSEKQVSDIARQFDLLVDNLNLLNTISQDLIDISKSIRAVFLRISELIEIQDDALEKIPTLQPSEHLLIKDLLDRQIIVLFRLQFEQDERAIARMGERFASLKKRTDESLQQYLAPPPATILQLKKEVDFYGVGSHNAFGKRIFQIELQSRIEETLFRNRFIVFELGKGVDGLFAAIHKRVRAQRSVFINQISVLLALAMSIPVITLIAALGTNIFLRRFVVSRILALEASMRDTSGATPMPTTGNDEIGSMARSVSYYLAGRKEYEASLR